MPKSIVPSPAAAVAVDRLTLQATDARAADIAVGQATSCLSLGSCGSLMCFSEE